MRIGIDIGTATTRIALPGRGVVVTAPSVIADCGALPLAVAVGEPARRVLGRTPAHIQAIQPIRRGVVGAPEATREMLHHLLRQAVGWKLKTRPQLVVVVPSRATLPERAALVAACPGTPRLIPAPVACAFGADAETARSRPLTVLDLGAGHTEVAVVSPAILARDSLSIGGEDLDRALAAHLRSVHGMEIDLQTAEELKLSGGGLVWGRELATGLPVQREVTAGTVREAITPLLERIAALVGTLLDSAPPSLSGEILSRGLVLTGGAARLEGLDRYLAERLGVEVAVAADASGCAARGALLAMEAGWRE